MALAEAAPVETSLGLGEEWPFRFEVVPLGRMFVDEAYQRPLTSFVKRIRANFDPALVGCLVLSQRRGNKFAIVDGQTRWSAMGTLGMEVAPCVVFSGLSQAQEADLFSRLQKERRGVMSYHGFRSDVVAKKPEALAIKRIVEACGYEAGPASPQAHVISAVAALRSAYRRGETQGVILERALLILRDAWGEKWGPSGDTIKGLAMYLENHPDIDDERLSRRLSIVSPDELKRRALGVQDSLAGGAGGGSSRERFMAQVIEAVYKRGKER